MKSGDPSYKSLVAAERDTWAVYRATDEKGNTIEGYGMADHVFVWAIRSHVDEGDTWDNVTGLVDNGEGLGDATEAVNFLGFARADTAVLALAEFKLLDQVTIETRELLAALAADKAPAN